MNNTLMLKENKLMKIMVAFMIMMMALVTYVAPVTLPSVSTNKTFATDCPSDRMIDPADGVWKKNTGTAAAPVYANMTDDEIKACQGTANTFIGKAMGFVSIMSVIAFVFAFVMVVYGGIKYIGSQGDERQTEEAKKTMWYAGD